MTPFILIAALLAANQPSAPMPPQPPIPDAPLHIAAPGGEVVMATRNDILAYQHGGYAAVRRSGDLLFLSGVVVQRRPEEGTDVAAFKDEVRRAFTRIGQSLVAAGANFDDVIMINSFHVWSGPDFAGSRDDQFKAFEDVKEEFMHGPHPAWTAVGSSGLLGHNSIVEIQMIAWAPQPASRRSK